MLFDVLTLSPIEEALCRINPDHIGHERVVAQVDAEDYNKACRILFGFVDSGDMPGSSHVAESASLVEADMPVMLECPEIEEEL